jgi:hypothetical protein
MTRTWATELKPIFSGANRRTTNWAERIGGHSTTVMLLKNRRHFYGLGVIAGELRTSNTHQLLFPSQIGSVYWLLAKYTGVRSHLE